MFVNDNVILKDGDMSGDLSATQQLQHALVYSVQAEWTGAGALGTLELLASLDNVSYDTITNSPTDVSGAGSFMWNVNDVGYNYVQVLFTHTSGSAGSLTVAVNYKGF